MSEQVPAEESWHDEFNRYMLDPLFRELEADVAHVPTQELVISWRRHLQSLVEKDLQQKVSEGLIVLSNN